MNEKIRDTIRGWKKAMKYAKQKNKPRLVSYYRRCIRITEARYL